MQKVVRILFFGIIIMHLNAAEIDLNNNNDEANVFRRYIQNEQIVANDYAKRKNINISLGWGGFDPAMSVTRDEMLQLPFFTSQSDRIHDLYANHWNFLHGNHDENSRYGFLDAIKLATAVGAGVEALYIYHKRIIDEDALDLQEKRNQEKMEQILNYFKGIWEFLKGESTHVFYTLCYLIGMIAVSAFLVSVALRLSAWLFIPPKPKIIDKEFLTFWYNDWYKKRPKSRLNELKYNWDIKQWLETNVYMDKSRVRHYNTRWRGRDKYSHKTILLKGPPGTGKTSLAEEYAKECGYNYIKVGAASWSQLPAGEAVSEFKKIIQRANASSRPVIIFIDEIDRLVSKISQSEVDNKVSGAFLNLFPMQRNKKIKFFFATNRHELLPDNFLSRCAEQVEIGYPSKEVAVSIFSEYIRKYAEKLKVDMQGSIAVPNLDNLNGRDIENLCTEAAERASLADEYITQQLIDKLYLKK